MSITYELYEVNNVLEVCFVFSFLKKMRKYVGGEKETLECIFYNISSLSYESKTMCCLTFDNCALDYSKLGVYMNVPVRALL